MNCVISVDSGRLSGLPNTQLFLQALPRPAANRS